MQVHAPVLRNTQFVGARLGHHDERGGLVDEGAGRHQLGKGEAHVGVVLRECGDGLCAVARPTRRQRVGLGHCGKACKKACAGFAVRIDRLPCRAAQRLSDERVHRNRRAHAVRLFFCGVHVLHATQPIGQGRRVFTPLQRQARALGRELRAKRLAAHDQRRLRFATCDALTSASEQHLRRIATLRGVNQIGRVLCTQAPGHGPGRVDQLAKG
jgi:hypothetical protein